MSIQYRLLGGPGKDNALAVWINSGTKMYRILFDCGENTVNELKYSDLTSVDYLLFSHFHLDHAAGFDYFLRRNYDRKDKPVRIIGPEDSETVIPRRLSGYTWNLVENIPGDWIITGINESFTKTFSLKASESFSKKHFRGKKSFDGNIINNQDFRVDAVMLNHIIPSVGYRITEKESYNIDKDKLAKLKFNPGPWLQKLKDLSVSGTTELKLNNKTYRLDYLRKLLLGKSKGESIAYLTDFLYDVKSRKRAVKLIRGCDTVFCESQYSQNDLKLAGKNYHLTSKQAAGLALKAGVKKLVLFHISDRYDIKKDYGTLIKDAREIFPNTTFPEEWNLD